MCQLNNMLDIPSDSENLVEKDAHRNKSEVQGNYIVIALSTISYH